jgi:NAD-dependent deacetylase
MDKKLIQKAAEKIKSARRLISFTGAGISVESGIPSFRGPDGLWSRYDPQVLDLSHFQRHPANSWRVIKEIFYDFFGKARPNTAHQALAQLETAEVLHGVITQNIDNLHQEAGSRDVIEFHGTSRRLTCLTCHQTWEFQPEMLTNLPPACPRCGGLLKPDFIFFGEGIPPLAYQQSMAEAQLADTWLVIGTTGEIMPASMLPIEARRNGALMIEVNLRPSNYTNTITDIFLQGKASEVLSALAEAVLHP